MKIELNSSGIRKLTTDTGELLIDWLPNDFSAVDVLSKAQPEYVPIARDAERFLRALLDAGTSYPKPGKSRHWVLTAAGNWKGE